MLLLAPIKTPKDCLKRSKIGLFGSRQLTKNSKGTDNNQIRALLFASYDNTRNRHRIGLIALSLKVGEWEH